MGNAIEGNFRGKGDENHAFPTQKHHFRTIERGAGRHRQQQEAAKGAAQQASREQESALEALNEWHAQYRKIARVALRDKSQLLEKIGIAARTSPPKARKKTVAV